MFKRGDENLEHPSLLGYFNHSWIQSINNLYKFLDQKRYCYAIRIARRPWQEKVVKNTFPSKRNKLTLAWQLMIGHKSWFPSILRFPSLLFLILCVESYLTSIHIIEKRGRDRNSLIAIYESHVNILYQGQQAQSFVNYCTTIQFIQSREYQQTFRAKIFTRVQFEKLFGYKQAVFVTK